MGPIIEVPNSNGGVTPVGLVSQIGATQSQATGGYAYRVALKSGSTGLTGLAAAAPIFSLQWVSTTLNALITRMTWNFTVTTVASAAGLLDSSLTIARSFTAADTGGTAITLTTNNAKKRTSYATTGMAMRIAQTTALTAGTRTLDANPIANDSAWLATGTLGPVGSGVYQELLPVGNDQEGILLAANEGLVLALIAAMPTSAVAQLYIDIDWKEIPIGSY